MKKVLIFMFLLTSLFVFAETDFEVPAQENFTKTVVLNLDTKDPNVAFGSSLLPIFGPSAAANYVSTTPVAWKTNEEIQKKATFQMLLNTGTIIGTTVAGYLLTGNSSDSTEDTTSDTNASYSAEYNDYDDVYSDLSFDGASGAMAGFAVGYLISFIENIFFGNQMAEIAVAYNKNLSNKLAWEFPAFNYEF